MEGEGGRAGGKERPPPLLCGMVIFAFQKLGQAKRKRCVDRKGIGVFLG